MAHEYWNIGYKTNAGHCLSRECYCAKNEPEKLRIDVKKKKFEENTSKMNFIHYHRSTLSIALRCPEHSLPHIYLYHPVLPAYPIMFVLRN